MPSARLLVMAIAPAFLASTSRAQTDMHTAPPSASPAASEARQAFARLKSLGGTWIGPVTLDSIDLQPGEANGAPTRVVFRVTSRGSAIVHEMKAVGTPDDPQKYDDPITMVYVEAGRLLLTHYCDAGNRPRMTGRVSPDGKRIQFDFVDLSGSDKPGHMNQAIFTFIDADHHVEDWTYLMPGGQPAHAHLDLRRASDTTSTRGN